MSALTSGGAFEWPCRPLGSRLSGVFETREGLHTFSMPPRQRKLANGSMAPFASFLGKAPRNPFILRGAKSLERPNSSAGPHQVARLSRDMGFGEGNFQALPVYRTAHCAVLPPRLRLGGDGSLDSIELDQGSRRCEAQPSRNRVRWTLGSTGSGAACSDLQLFSRRISWICPA